jgi:hypothetical protein
MSECPFCGKTELEPVNDDGIFWMRCRTCDATGPKTSKYSGEEGEPFVDWNTRAAPFPAPAVGELVRTLQWLHENGTFLTPHEKDVCRQAAARISQLEAALEAALPYVEAANRAEHLMDGFGPRSRQSSDEHVAAIRALLKGQS